MGQNTSSAVMAQRVEPADSFDDFPTPPWATRALCELLLKDGTPLRQRHCWEPACGRGDMARPLAEYFDVVHASDVQSFGYGVTYDFLLPSKLVTDWIATNPPFKLAEEFVLTALERASEGVAMLTRLSFLESTGRYQRLFNLFPPTSINQFAERVPMLKGRLDRAGSTATAYCWLVWRVGRSAGTQFRWIAPCRKRLEKDGDY